MAVRMPQACHHLCAVTEDPDGVLKFVSNVLGVKGREQFTVPGANLERALGWPAGSPDAGMHMLGSGVGKLEIIGAPAGTAAVPKGFVLASYAVRDLRATVALARSLGFQVTEPNATRMNGQSWQASFAVVGGLTFELIQYNLR